MKKFLFVVLILVFSCAAVSAQTVTGSIGKGTVERGKTARGSVVLNIPGGLHVNSSRPASEFAIATVVKVSGASGIRVTGLTYPKGKNRKFAFSENTIACSTALNSSRTLPGQSCSQSNAIASTVNRRFGSR